MIRSASLRALLLSIAAVACTSDGPLRRDGQQPVAVANTATGPYPVGIKILANRAPPPSINVVSEVPYTFEIAVVDSLGRFLQNAQVVFGRSTGYIKAFGAPDSEWRSSGDAALVTNNLGRVAFRWHTGADAKALLIVDINRQYPGSLPGKGEFLRTRDTLVSANSFGTTEAVVAEQVAPSGVHSTCFLQTGRVGCVGSVDAEHATDWSLARAIAVAEPRWLQFSAKPVALRSVAEGACALLETGSVACWRGLGPDGVVRTSVNQIAVAEFSGRLALSSNREVLRMRWDAKPTSAPVFRGVFSDSVLVGLFLNGGDVACGYARSGTVLCAPGAAANLDSPSMKVARANPLREVIVSDGGAISDGAEDGQSGSETVLLARRGGLLNAFYVRGAEFLSQSAFASLRPSVDSISPGNGTERSCSLVLATGCTGGVWRSVMRFGGTGGVATSRDPVGQAYTRICGIRGVVVCSWISRSQARRSFDTLRIRGL